jgi:hypothetical protein
MNLPTSSPTLRPPHSRLPRRICAHSRAPPFVTRRPRPATSWCAPRACFLLHSTPLSLCRSCRAAGALLLRWTPCRRGLGTLECMHCQCVRARVAAGSAPPSPDMAVSVFRRAVRAQSSRARTPACVPMLSQRSSSVTRHATLFDVRLA